MSTDEKTPAPVAGDIAGATGTPDAIEAISVRHHDPAHDPAFSAHQRAGRGVDWVRPTDLMARHSAHAAGHGLDFQAELARRTRTTIGAGVRRLGDRARRLPPISAFGRSTAPASQMSRSGVSMS